MGKIKKILENELVGSTQTTDIYPVTSIKAVYDESNERLDNIIRRKGIVNISTNYNSNHIAEVFTLVLKGTVDEQWFYRSNTSEYVTIGVDQLLNVLEGKPFTPKKNVEVGFKIRF